MSNPRSETIAATYQAAIDSTRSEAEKVPADKRMHQNAEGKAHALWLLGHLTLSQDLIVNQWILGGDAVIPADYNAKFAPGIMGGGAPTANADDYPAWGDVLSNYNAACAKTVELIGALNDDELGGKVKGDIPEAAQGFFTELAPSLIGMALHLAHHRGQIGVINGSLG